jgi:TolB-like protein
MFELFSGAYARWIVRFAAALVLCPGLGIGWSAAFAQAQSPATGRPRVAVMPFEINEASQDYFAGGLTDEIAAALTSVRGLDVVARSSVFRLPAQLRDSRGIGKALNADYLVQGTTRLVGDRVRINAWVTRADDGRQLWSDNYYAELPNIFDLEEDIAEKVAGALQVPLGLQNGEMLVRNRTTDMEAYQNFLRAKTVARARGQKPLADAAILLERAVTRAPNYAPALALLGYDYALSPLFERSLRSGMPEEQRKVSDKMVPRAAALALLATQLDPNAADGFVALGYANMVQRRMLAAEDAFKLALQRDPNQADGLHGYSQLLAALGRIKESLAMREHLQTIEQGIVNYTADTAEIYWLDGQTDKAIAMLQPFRPGRTLELALIQAAAGRYRESAALVREMPAVNYPAGMTEAAAKVLESAPARAATPESLPRLGNLGFAYLYVGAPERTLEFYEDEIKGNYFQPISTTWFWHPAYSELRKTMRFKTLMSDLGLAAYWRVRGWPAQCHAVGTADFACE